MMSNKLGKTDEKELGKITSCGNALTEIINTLIREWTAFETMNKF